MYGITIERVFSAAHALRFPDGSQEELHGHNWELVIEIRREELDEIGLVADFHAIEAAVDELLPEFHNKNINMHPHFVHTNPSAELIAAYFFDQLENRLEIAPALLWRVTVSEAPGCRATRWRAGLGKLA